MDAFWFWHVARPNWDTPLCGMLLFTWGQGPCCSQGTASPLTASLRPEYPCSWSRVYLLDFEVQLSYKGLIFIAVFFFILLAISYVSLIELPTTSHKCVTCKFAYCQNVISNSVKNNLSKILLPKGHDSHYITYSIWFPSSTPNPLLSNLSEINCWKGSVH